MKSGVKHVTSSPFISHRIGVIFDFNIFREKGDNQNKKSSIRGLKCVWLNFIILVYYFYYEFFNYPLFRLFYFSDLLFKKFDKILSNLKGKIDEMIDKEKFDASIK